jgi:hypothetical protein
MAKIPLFGLGVSAKSPFVTAKVLQNMYCEIRPDGEKSKLVAYGVPGKDAFIDFGVAPSRGAIEFESRNVAYVVNGATLWEISAAGAMVSRGTLLTTVGRVSLSHNGVQVMIVDGQFGYIYNTDTAALTLITAAGFPSNPTTVTYIARRFVASFLNSSRFYWSDIDDGLAWDALNFANAESSPDPIVSVWTSNGQLILLGSVTTEFWGNSGLADQPFVALQGTANEWGLAARWSIAKFDNTFACLIKNRMGNVMIAQMSGYLPKPISTVDVSFLINEYTVTDDASAYSYMVGLHPMYIINFPTAGKSWMFDGSTGMWHLLKSFGLTRDRAEFSVNLGGETIVADYASGDMYRMNQDTLTEAGSPIEGEIIGETISSADGEFIPADCLRLDMETGIGTTVGQGVNPQVCLSVSRDNGKTWGAEMWKSAGAIGGYKSRVEWRRLGTQRAFTPKITISDPVRRVFVSACLNPDN